MWGCWYGGGGTVELVGEVVIEMVGGGQGIGSSRHCMPPMTLAPTAVADDGSSSLRESSFRLPGRGVSCHIAHRAREEGVVLAMDSL